MVTRTRGSAKTAKEEVPSATIAKTQLRPESSNPPKIFILPKNISQEARVVILSNPQSANEDRYLVCPEKGFYEFTKAAAPRKTPRSWLLSASEPEDSKSEDQEKKDDGDKEASAEEEDDLKYRADTGYVTKTADLYIATPFDPLFFILPTLAPQAKASDSKKLFLASEEYFDQLSTESPHFRSLFQKTAIRELFEARMSAVCDKVDAGDESMYRLNEAKLLSELLSKAQELSKDTLPSSMEEGLIREALRKPMLSLKRGETSHELEDEEASSASGTQTPTTSTTTITTEDSQSTAATSTMSFSSDIGIDTLQLQPSTPKAAPPIDAPENIIALLRLRTAFTFILSSYLAPHMSTHLATQLRTSGSEGVDFKPLDTHLAELAELKQAALASRSMSDFSRKRGVEDEEAGEGRLAKKKKMEEEEKRRKAGESRGVRELKKVNVSGMKKMSDFFKKKA